MLPGFCTGMLLGSASAGEPGWTPADLFASGEEGGWYDPSDLSKLWKDTAGTDPVTTHDDLVARIDDKSGNGNHVLQATEGARPRYRTDGSKHWLRSDGGDSMAVAMAEMAQPHTAVLGMRLPTGAVSTVFFIDSTTTSKRRAVFRFSTDLRMWAGVALTGLATLATGTDYVLYHEFNGASSFARINGSQTANGNAGTEPAAGLRFFADQNDANKQNYSLYQVVVIDRVLTAQEISDLEAFMEAKTGAVF